MSQQMKLPRGTLRKEFAYNSRPRYSQRPGRRNTPVASRDLVSIVQLGLSDVVIAKIRTTSAIGPDSVSFDTSTEGLKALKAANVPDSVIKSYD